MKKIDLKIYLYDSFLINYNYNIFLKDTYLDMNFYSFSLESELIK
jgi:hypothetical protein